MAARKQNDRVPITSGTPISEDVPLDYSLRPRSLREFIGQAKVKDNLKIAIAAAEKRGEPLDHTLLYGPPGLGKTTLAYIIAAEMGVNIKVSSGPAIERPGDLAAILTSLREGDILFLDEIHRLGHTIEEKLYPAMEDFVFDIFLGKGAGARSLRLNLPHFTLIGATTRFALLSPPLRDRFGAVYHLDFYDQTAIETILERSAAIIRVRVEGNSLFQIAKRARG
ncbi:MAG: Holliday junction branch migration DNA helicase RuvB, partial [Dehalococcoidia bacterium]